MIRAEAGGVAEVDMQTVVAELIRSYGMEIETVQNYLAASINLDGVRAQQIKKILHDDIEEELKHAKRLARRIHILSGTVPGSFELKPDQGSMQPPRFSTDVVTVIRGVIEAEQAAIDQYNKIIRMCDGADFSTQDLCIDNLRDEEEHRRLFAGFLKEYE